MRFDHATASARRLIRALFWLALLFAVTMALLPHPPRLGPELNDKWGHMVAFATLSTLAALGFPETPLPRLGERLSFLGALIEVFQATPAIARDCDPLDWVADTVAVAVVLGLVAWRRRPIAGGAPTRANADKS